MTEPQVWTIIGVLTATMIGFMTLTITLVLRTINAQFSGLRAEMNARFEVVEARFEVVEARFDAVYQRMDNLDRDVQAIARRTFGMTD